MSESNEHSESFPIYRKYVEKDVWFKIVSEIEFIEVKRVGKRLVSEKIDAQQYPEVLRVQDMINCHENRWEEVGAPEVEELLDQV